MAPKCPKNDRVKVLATRFDEGSEDRNGDPFSVVHQRNGNGEHCFGNIAHVYSVTNVPGLRVFAYTGYCFIIFIVSNTSIVAAATLPVSYYLPVPLTESRKAEQQLYMNLTYTTGVSKCHCGIP